MDSALKKKKKKGPVNLFQTVPSFLDPIVFFVNVVKLRNVVEAKCKCGSVLVRGTSHSSQAGVERKRENRIALLES